MELDETRLIDGSSYHDVVNCSSQSTIRNGPSKTHQHPILRRNGDHSPQPISSKPHRILRRRRGVVRNDLRFWKDGNDDTAVGQGNAELVEVDGIGAAVGGEGGEAVAGVVGEGVEVSKVVRVHVGWVCGYE